MQPEDIEIHVDTPEGELEPLGRVDVSVGATLFSNAPTLEDVNLKLREKAARLGANAVISVAYTRGITLTSWRAMSASGLAVRLESEDTTCPFCAETIKRAAVICRFCNRDVQSTPSK